jgi:hypothetical protein
MNVDLVHNSSAGIERLTPDKKPPAAQLARNNEAVIHAKAEISSPKNIAAPLSIPVHEVKVILDTSDNNTLVYQVLDKDSGDVVLQVPTADQLRGIHESQELLQRIAARGKAGASEPAASSGKVEGNGNGNQL